MSTNKCLLPLDEQCQLAQEVYQRAILGEEELHILVDVRVRDNRISLPDMIFLGQLADYAQQGLDYITALEYAHISSTGEILILDD